MRLDLFLRVRRDRFNLAIRLRLLGGAAAVFFVIVVLAGDGPFSLRWLPGLPLAAALLPTDVHREAAPR